jgi:hypothetical protein
VNYLKKFWANKKFVVHVFDNVIVNFFYLVLIAIKILIDFISVDVKCNCNS